MDFWKILSFIYNLVTSIPSLTLFFVILSYFGIYIIGTVWFIITQITNLIYIWWSQIFTVYTVNYICISIYWLLIMWLYKILVEFQKTRKV